MDVLGNRYQLQEPIGRGNLATIYCGWDTHMERVVAVKVLREIYITDPKFVRLFQKEAEVMYSLQHPNIVQAYDYGQSNGNYYIVMELVDGINLHRYLRSRGILDAGSTVKIAQNVALGLGEAHRRDIVHRNVIPQNILIGRDGSIKLTDFSIGIALTLGTVQYYAPEQARGVVSPSADVYSLGIVMYEMLTLHPPFDGDSPEAVAMKHIQEVPTPPSQYNPTIPTALEEIIMRCLEKEPQMRFQDASQLARALEALSGEKEPPTIGS
jgi:serine/threonine-protein kinase